MSNNISMSGALPEHRLCFACKSNNYVEEITFTYENDGISQGTTIALCKNCRKQLFDLLGNNLFKGESKIKPIDGNELYERIDNFYQHDKHIYELNEKKNNSPNSYSAEYIEAILDGIKSSKPLF